MARQMDYDRFAAQYAHTRWAVPWIVDPLLRTASALPPGSRVLEIGCGTANYLLALRAELDHHHYAGFDRSGRMLAVARRRGPDVDLRQGNAERRFPFRSGSFHFAFAVDVLHHIHELCRFFAEARRVLAPLGHLVVVTDSEENIRSRSLTRFFPEILQLELDRYPSLTALEKAAGRAGLALTSAEPAEGTLELDAEFLAKLQAKCSSAMRLISDADHHRGMQRVRRAGEQGQRWHSCYTVLRYEQCRS